MDGFDETFFEDIQFTEEIINSFTFSANLPEMPQQILNGLTIMNEDTTINQRNHEYSLAVGQASTSGVLLNDVQIPTDTTSNISNATITIASPQISSTEFPLLSDVNMNDINFDYGFLEVNDIIDLPEYNGGNEETCSYMKPAESVVNIESVEVLTQPIYLTTRANLEPTEVSKKRKKQDFAIMETDAHYSGDTIKVQYVKTDEEKANKPKKTRAATAKAKKQQKADKNLSLARADAGDAQLDNSAKPSEAISANLNQIGSTILIQQKPLKTIREIQVASTPASVSMSASDDQSESGNNNENSPPNTPIESIQQSRYNRRRKRKQSFTAMRKNVECHVMETNQVQGSEITENVIVDEASPAKKKRTVTPEKEVAENSGTTDNEYNIVITTNYIENPLTITDCTTNENPVEIEENEVAPQTEFQNSEKIPIEIKVFIPATMPIQPEEITEVAKEPIPEERTLRTRSIPRMTLISSKKPRVAKKPHDKPKINEIKINEVKEVQLEEPKPKPPGEKLISTRVLRSSRNKKNFEEEKSKIQASLKMVECEICHKSFKALNRHTFSCKSKLNAPTIPSAVMIPTNTNKVAEKEKEEVKIDKIGQNVDSFTCSVCSKKYRKQSYLVTHQNEFHGNYKCESCLEVFQIKSVFTKHRRICGKTKPN